MRELPMSGRDAAGHLYTVDNISLKKDGERLLPVMGEFHYSRWEPEHWEEELLKMKAGGIEVVATYIFWIHHEERPGEWDFSGCRDIGRFVRLCQTCGLKVWLRIGPWVHAECRHGGFPDFIQWSEDFEPRTNDPGYLAAVKSLFDHLAGQLSGMMAKDGGPVIGVQLENEYGHVGGPADPDVRHAHMDTLKQMAIDAGFDVPYYCATGWGDAYVTEETFPMMGGYVDAPWATDTKPLPASRNYLFRRYRNDPSIGTDGRREGRREAESQAERFPYFSAELGAGLQVTSHRRPVVSAADTEANLLCLLGSGLNLIGYYMYHGGINPDGKYSTLNETQEIGGYTTLPVKSYDFEAPINEAGRLNASYGALKKHHYVVQDYHRELAAAEPVFPQTMPADPEDLSTIRMALRRDAESGIGFLFVNNHQRNRSMQAHPDVSVRIGLPGDGCIELSDLRLPADTMGIIPFMLPVGEAVLERTNAYYMGHLGKRHFFYTDGWDAEFVLRVDGETRRISAPCGTLKAGPAGSAAEWITVLSRPEADRAFRFSDGMYIAGSIRSAIYERENRKILLTEEAEERIRVIREDGSVKELSAGAAGHAFSGAVTFSPEAEERDEEGIAARSYRLRLDGMENLTERGAVSDIYLVPEYSGDRAEVYLDGKLIDDWYTTGEEWYISLNRFGYPRELTLRIYPSSRPIPCTWGSDVYYERPVESGCELKGASLKARYRIIPEEP